MLSSYMRERDDLNAEWGVCLEQQTFGATAQGTRANSTTHVFATCCRNGGNFFTDDLRAK